MHSLYPVINLNYKSTLRLINNLEKKSKIIHIDDKACI